MRELRYRPAQGLIQRHLLGGIGKMIVAPDHVRNLHQGIVNYHHIVVNRHPVRTQDDGITYYLVRKLYLSVHDVMETDGMLGNAQTDRTRFPACPAPTGFSRSDGPALARIDRLAMFGLCPFAFLLQLGFGTET